MRAHRRVERLDAQAEALPGRANRREAMEVIGQERWVGAHYGETITKVPPCARCGPIVKP